MVCPSGDNLAESISLFQWLICVTPPDGLPGSSPQLTAWGFEC